MIRDPSDGTVREPQKSAPVVTAPHNSGERDPAVMPDWAGADTGLAPIETSLMARIERSRVWLKEYHARKGAFR